jgi:hypothetical protein
MLCNDPASVFQGGALCPNRTIRESMHWSACAWRQIACNWRGTFRTLLCSRISFGWRGNGPAWRIKDRTRILRPSAGTQTKNRTNRNYLAAARLRDGRPQRPVTKSLPRATCELAIICFLKAWVLRLLYVGTPVDMSLAVLGFLTSCVALLCRPEPQLRAASRRHRTVL